MPAITKISNHEVIRRASDIVDTIEGQPHKQISIVSALEGPSFSTSGYLMDNLSKVIAYNLLHNLSIPENYNQSHLHHDNLCVIDKKIEEFSRDLLVEESLTIIVAPHEISNAYARHYMKSNFTYGYVKPIKEGEAILFNTSRKRCTTIILPDKKRIAC